MRDLTHAEWEADWRNKSRKGNAHSPVMTGGPGRQNYRATCSCGWNSGKASPDRKVPEDAADAHRLFTHTTGSYLCGHPNCPGCHVVLRYRALLGLPARIIYSPPDRLRNLGSLPASVEVTPFDEPSAAVVDALNQALRWYREMIDADPNWIN